MSSLCPLWFKKTLCPLYALYAFMVQKKLYVLLWFKNGKTSRLYLPYLYQ
jgi:hypothetical protein